MILQRINRLSRDVGIEDILLIQVSSVQRLVGAFDLDGDGGVALLYDAEVCFLETDGGDAAEDDDFFFAVGFGADGGDGGADAERAFDDVDADDDGVFFVEDLDGAEDAGEDGAVGGFFAAEGEHFLGWG